MNKDTPAFPRPANGETGMTFRQYAAIKLRVPDSGEEWLDNMIKKSLWNEFAGKANSEWLVKLLNANKEGCCKEAARIACLSADAMVSELEKRGDK